MTSQVIKAILSLKILFLILMRGFFFLALSNTDSTLWRELQTLLVLYSFGKTVPHLSTSSQLLQFLFPGILPSLSLSFPLLYWIFPISTQTYCYFFHLKKRKSRFHFLFQFLLHFFAAVSPLKHHLYLRVLFMFLSSPFMLF